jgi:hypothetical protein
MKVITEEEKLHILEWLYYMRTQPVMKNISQRAFKKEFSCMHWLMPRRVGKTTALLDIGRELRKARFRVLSVFPTFALADAVMRSQQDLLKATPVKGFSRTNPWEYCTVDMFKPGNAKIYDNEYDFILYDECDICALDYGHVHFGMRTG